MGRLSLLLLIGCGGPQWRNADLQIDVWGQTVSDEARVRVCVTDSGSREQAVGASAMTFPGLPAQGSLEIQIDLMDDDLRAARAGPIELGDGENYTRIKWSECTEDCLPCDDDGRGAPKGADNRLLAIRFGD